MSTKSLRQLSHNDDRRAAALGALTRCPSMRYEVKRLRPSLVDGRREIASRR